MSEYINDLDRISQPMGQFQVWFGKIFYWSGSQLGWRYVKGVAA